MQQKIKYAFQLLELPPHASLEDVKQSYRSLAKKYHPDIVGEKANDSKFVELAKAYQLLVDYFENPQKYTEQPTTAQTANGHRHSRSKEDLSERMRKANERAQTQEKAEREVIFQAYNKIQRPFLKRIHILISLISLLLCLFLATDYFLPETKRTVEIQHISKLYYSTRFEQVTAVATYGNEVFYVDGKVLLHLYSERHDDFSSDAKIVQSQLLHVPRKIEIVDLNNQSADFDIDEPIYWQFPVYFVLLMSGILFYLIQQKKMFSRIIFFYATLGFSIVGLLMILLNGTFGRIIGSF